MKKKTIKRRKCSTILMGDGRGKATTVIDGGDLKHYVGIGWITRRKATKDDRKKYPCVKD